MMCGTALCRIRSRSGSALMRTQKTLDELLPDDVAVSLMGLEDEVQRQRYKNQMRDVARRGKFVQAFDAQIRAYEKQAAAERKEQKAAEQAEREANRDHTIRLTGAPLAA